MTEKMPEIEFRDFGGIVGQQYRCKEMDLLFGRIAGGMTWPSEANTGVAVVIGEEVRPLLGTNTFPCHWIWEIEESDMSALTERCIELQVRLGANTFYGRHTNMTKQILNLWNRDARDRRSRQFHLSTAPHAEPDGKLQYHLELLKSRFKSGRQSVYLSESSKIPGYLDELLPEETPQVTDISHPHVGALAYVITALTTTQPEIDDYSPEPDDYDPLNYCNSDDYNS